MFGELAGPPPKSPGKNDEMETVELDNEEPEEVAAIAPAAAKAKKAKKDKSFQVPNFEASPGVLITHSEAHL